MKNATTIKVPKKYEHMIEEIWTEDDGWFGNGLSYWVSIADGFYSPEMYSHTLHESTQKEILRLIRGIKRETYRLVDESRNELAASIGIKEAKEASIRMTPGQHVESECTGDVMAWGQTGVNVVVFGTDCEILMEASDKMVKVEWVDMGEGLYGDFDPDDIEDINLLRFDVYIRKGKDWVAVEDASYCTKMPVDTDTDVLRAALLRIFREYKDALKDYPYTSVKKLGERLSWMGPDDLA